MLVCRILWQLSILPHRRFRFLGILRDIPLSSEEVSEITQVYTGKRESHISTRLKDHKGHLRQTESESQQLRNTGRK